MEARGRFVDWRFTGFELLGAAASLISLAVGITLWSVSTFQSKIDAKETKDYLERRIDGVETQMSNLRTSLDAVARDTSYIRGRLEPKQ